MGTTTVNGIGNQHITLTFDSTSNFALAKQIAAQINAEVAAGKVVFATDADAPPTVPAGDTGVFIQVGPGPIVLQPGYTADIVKTTGSAVVFGSGETGQAILSDQAASLTFIETRGSGSVVAGGGTNQLRVSGPGDWSLNAGNGNDIIAAVGSGNNTIAAGGGNNAIQLGSGNDLVISVGSDSIQAGTGNETVDATRATSDYVRGSASNLLFLGGVGGATIFGGSGSDTYFGSASGPTGDQVIVGGTAGNNLLWAGNGAATLVGGGNNDQLYAYGSTGQLLKAGLGNETLSAVSSGGNDSLVAGPGSDLLIDGTGNDTFVGGSGSSTVEAGTGQDVYAFIKGQGGGTELVQDILDPSAIKINLQGYGHGAIDSALDSQTQGPAGVTISLSDGTKVTFQDVTSLHRSNFV